MDPQDKSVAYCSLYCPGCYKMVVSKAAESLNYALNNTHICGSVHDSGPHLRSELKNLMALRCPKLCKEGGGNQDCKIRACCLKKSLNGCWECDEFEGCSNLKDQYISNIKKIRELGIDGFVKMSKERT